MTASGTKDDPWQLTTAPGSSSYTMYRDEESDPPLLVCQVGSTKLTYLLRVLDDLPAWLREQGDWVPLGAADEKKHGGRRHRRGLGRSEDNPVGGWYGQRKGYRGRLGMYVPPLLEALGLAELTHEARNNQVRASGTDRHVGDGGVARQVEHVHGSRRPRSPARSSRRRRTPCPPARAPSAASGSRCGRGRRW